MQTRQYTSPAALAGCLKCLWTAERDFQAAQPPLEILPDTDVELVFSVGARVRLLDGHSLYDLPHFYLVGLQAQPLYMRIEGVHKIAAARFHPWGFYALFGRGKRLPQSIYPLDGVWQPLAAAIARALKNDDDGMVVTLLQDFLMERAAHAACDTKTIQAASQLIRQANGRVTISDLADHCFLSPRQLERQFDSLVGMPPKSLACQIRFEKVCSHLRREPRADLATLAHDYGYADQAHLTREFKRFSRRTPTQFAAASAAQPKLLI